MESGIDRAKSSANRALTSTHMIDSDYESAAVILNVVNHYPASIERGDAPAMVIWKRLNKWVRNNLNWRAFDNKSRVLELTPVEHMDMEKN